MSADDKAQASALAGRTTYEGLVASDWIDANGHMNVSRYDGVFDQAEAALFDGFGVNEDYIRQHRFGMFRLEKRIRYRRELLQGDALRAESLFSTADERIFRHVHRLLNVGTGVCAAICEAVSIHVDLSRRKSAPINHVPTLLRMRDCAAGADELKAFADL